MIEYPDYLKNISYDTQKNYIKKNIQWYPFNLIEYKYFNYINANKFMHKNLKQRIIELKKHCEVTFTSNRSHFTLNVISSYCCDNYINRFIHICNFISQLALQPQHIIIIYIDIDIDKKVPKNGINTCEPEHINSGVCINREVIIVFRREEATKVVLHELIHAYNLDLVQHQASMMTLRDLVPIDKESVFLPNEAVTDAIALILYAYLSTPWFKDMSASERFEQDCMWTYIQAAKILKLNKVKLKGKHNNDTSNVMHQSTACMSYYVLKAALFWEIQKNKNIFLFKVLLGGSNLFNIEGKHRAEYIKTLLQKILTSEEFIEFINIYIPKLNKNSQTLRMSSYAL